MSRPRAKTFLYNIMAKGHSPLTIIASLAVTLIIVYYPLVIGSYFEPPIYRFEDRLTYYQFFGDQYFFNQFTDYVIISLAFLTWSAIGFRHRTTRWIASVSIALTLVIAVYGTVTNLGNINNDNLGNRSVLFDFMALVTLPSVLAIIILDKALGLVLLSTQVSLKLTLNYLLISVGLLSLFSIAASAFKTNDPFIDIYFLIARFSPILMLILIFSLPLKMTCKYFCEKALKIRSTSQRSAELLGSVCSGEDKFIHIGKWRLRTAIGSIMVLSVVIVIIPNIDDYPGPIGEDTLTYVRWLRDLPVSSNSSGSALPGDTSGNLFHKTFVTIADGDRPLSLLLIYLTYIALPFISTVTLVDLVLPALLAPLSILAVYFLTKELTTNTLAVLFACFIAALSFQVVAGIYAGFYANWIALIAAYMSLVFLLRFLKTSRKSNVILFFISLLFLLFAHGYTWAIILMFSFLFSIVLWAKRQYPPHLFKFVFAALFSVIVVDLVESASTGATLELTRAIDLTKEINTSPVQAAASPAVLFAQFAGIDPQQFELIWGNLVFVSQAHLAGVYGNFVLLLLALYGILLVRKKSTLEIFILIYISLAIPALFLGNKIILSRVLFDIPFQISAGLAMANLVLSRQGGLKGTAIILTLLAVSIYFVLNIASITQNIP